MSTAFNSYTVTRNNVSIPYITSTCEIGYFGNITSGDSNDNWYSIPTYLISNNGIATVGLNNGLQILNPGIYKIHFGLDLNTYQGTDSNTISFFFGTVYLNNSNSPSGNFGGAKTSGLYSYGTSSPNHPGIISWITDSYSSGNGDGRLAINDGQYLVYDFYSKGTNTGAQVLGICTSELTFTLSTPTNIFFNLSCDKGFTTGNCWFVLQLLTTQYA